MCSDENAAPHAVRYLNAQLAVLHQNARKCIEEHEHGSSDRNSHAYALAAFRVRKPGIANYAFETMFDKPELEFVCNHNAILHVTLLDSTLRVKTVTGGSHEVHMPDRLRLSYRLGFETRKIIGNDQKVGGSGAIELIILGIKEATFLLVDKPEEVTRGMNALLDYMKDYFQLLHSAGHHVLFSLPQFDQRAAGRILDYSLQLDRTHYDDARYIYDVSAKQINLYLSNMWIKSVSAMDGDVSGSHKNWRSRCLAEYNTWWKAGGAYGHFHMRLGPPRVEILCSKEVIVYFNIRELKFFKNDPTEPTREYKDWTIAMVVNVHYTSESDGHVVNIALDLNHARFHDFESTFTSLEHDEESYEYWRHLIRFFNTEYLHVLKSIRYHVIYSRDTRWETVNGKHITATQEATDGSWWSLELANKSGASSRETVRRTKMCGFDQVVAISQGSINSQYAMLAANTSSILYQWSHGDNFQAFFKPLTIHLLSHNRAIVWVHVQNGSFKLLQNTNLIGSGKHDVDLEVSHHFTEMRLAFEVGLKICSQKELEGSTSEIYSKTAAYIRHGTSSDHDLRHVYLDLHNPEYLPEYSNLGELGSDDVHLESIHQSLSIVHHIKWNYFPALCDHALHVISSVPVWTGNHHSLPSSYAWTSVAFQVYSKVEITRYNWTHISAEMEPSLVLLGATRNRPLVSTTLDYSTRWIVQGESGFSHGTVSISKHVFIEERLLGLLSSVNEYTTLIPTEPHGVSAFQGLKLVSWKQHEERKDRPSKWERQPSDGDDSLKYLWHHREAWTHGLSGNSDILSAEYGIQCVTKNYLELPTTVKQGALCIKISGSVEFDMSLRTTQTYTAKASVSWSRTIKVQTIGSGVTVVVEGPAEPHFSVAEYSEGAKGQFKDPRDMLREAFPKAVHLNAVINEINVFEGPWQYCYPLASAYSLASPVFNEDGDLLFELRRHDATDATGLIMPGSDGLIVPRIPAQHRWTRRINGTVNGNGNGNGNSKAHRKQSKKHAVQQSPNPSGRLGLPAIDAVSHSEEVRIEA